MIVVFFNKLRILFQICVTPVSTMTMRGFNAKSVETSEYSGPAGELVSC